MFRLSLQTSVFLRLAPPRRRATARVRPVLTAALAAGGPLLALPPPGRRLRRPLVYRSDFTVTSGLVTAGTNTVAFKVQPNDPRTTSSWAGSTGCSPRPSPVRARRSCPFGGRVS